MSKNALKLTPSDEPDPSGLLKQYERLSNDELLAEFAKWALLSAEGLLRMAALWHLAQNRGVEKTIKEIARAFYLDRIFAGVTLPALVAAFSSKPTTLKHLVLLPPATQQDFVDGDPVLFVVKPGESRNLPVRELSPRQLLQVFDRGIIRDEPAQIAYICRPAPPPKIGKVARSGKARADRSTGLCHIGNNYTSALEMIDALVKAGFIVPPKKDP